jgi:hypothetical protein
MVRDLTDSDLPKFSQPEFLYFGVSNGESKNLTVPMLYRSIYGCLEYSDSALSGDLCESNRCRPRNHPIVVLCQPFQDVEIVSPSCSDHCMSN